MRKIQIMYMNVNATGDRKWAVTSQVGKFPSVFVWNTQTGQKRYRFKLNNNSRQMSAIGMSPDCKYIACADRSDEHMFFAFDVGSRQLVSYEKGGRDLIHYIYWSKKEDSY